MAIFAPLDVVVCNKQTPVSSIENLTIFISPSRRAISGWALASYIFVALLSSSAYAQNISPSEAAESARQITQGKVLKVKPTKTTLDNKTHYRVKVLSPEGRVSYIIIDGNNGEIHPRPQTSHITHKRQSPKTHYTETGL